MITTRSSWINFAFVGPSRANSSSSKLKAATNMNIWPRYKRLSSFSWKWRYVQPRSRTSFWRMNSQLTKSSRFLNPSELNIHTIKTMPQALIQTSSWQARGSKSPIACQLWLRTNICTLTISFWSWASKKTLSSHSRRALPRTKKCLLSWKLQLWWMFLTSTFLQTFSASSSRNWPPTTARNASFSSWKSRTL